MFAHLLLVHLYLVSLIDFICAKPFLLVFKAKKLTPLHHIDIYELSTCVQKRAFRSRQFPFT